MKREANSAKIYCLLLALIAPLYLPCLLSAQNEKERLQSDKNRIEKEIEYTNQLLNETQQSKQTSMSQLLLLNQQIKQRAELINTINKEVEGYDATISRTNDTVQQLLGQLSVMKQDYARLIYAANRHRNAYSRLMFIFSANDFNQGYKRIKYFQQYGAYRKTQAQKIVEVQQLLNEKKNQLEAQKVEKLELRAAYEKEKRQFGSTQNKQNQSLKELSQKERELLKNLRENERAVQKLQKAIGEVIANEMKKANETARKAGEKAPVGFALTPEEEKLSDNFSNNKGLLPWPSERGVIASSFGEHPHPVLKGIKTQNNGIDIATNKGAAARSVFNGVVSNVLTIPSLNNVVILKHGEFLTVYSNLDEVFVKKGDNVLIKQSVGIVHTDEQGAKTRLNFQIWKGKELLDPEQWLVTGSVNP